MTPIVQTAQSIIKGALRRIVAYQSGEQLASTDASDCLETLNDLLDSLSTDKNSIFGSVESIFQWIPGQAQYTVGNPTAQQIGGAPFLGTVTQGSNVITNVTSIPSNLLAGGSASGTGAGSTLSDLGGVIPEGTYVTAIGANTVTMSAPAAASYSGQDRITYTVPGNIAIPRPLRITGLYTRVNQLDFWCDVYATQDEYNAVLYKMQPGPWPTIAWYNPAFPYGVLNIYQAPGLSGEVHLFTDTILSNLTLNQVVILPQGYTRALKWLLAKEICAEFGYPLTEAIKVNADASWKLIKALNAQPAPKATYDRALLTSNRAGADWILHGGMGYGR